MHDTIQRILHDPHRLQAVEDTHMLDSPNEESFDRLTKLATQVLKTSMAFVFFTDDHRNFLKSSYGLPEKWKHLREIPVEDSICQFTLMGEPMAFGNTKNHPLLEGNPWAAEKEVSSYLGIPMITKNGLCMGSFCVIDSNPREWTDEEISILHDLTRSAMAEIELRVVVDQLQSERDLRETFVSTLTHDLRSPLSAAKLNLELIQRSPSDISRLPKVMVSLVKIDKMVQNLLDANLVRAGHPLPLHMNPGDLSVALDKITDTLSVPSRTKIVKDIDPGVEGVFDMNAMERLTENLVGNAVKYGDTAQPITLCLKRAEKEIEISVHNYGNPISEREQISLFHPYRRSSSALASGVKGWGLGLTLVRGVAHGHGGEVKVRSNPNDGTTFTVTLPVREADSSLPHGA